jgi:hypothetical protein
VPFGRIPGTSIGHPLDQRITFHKRRPERRAHAGGRQEALGGIAPLSLSMLVGANPGQAHQQRRSTPGTRMEPSTRRHGRVRGSADHAVGGLTIKRALLLVAIGTVIVSWFRPAAADPARGPFQVMDPDGTVVRISSEAAEAWWSDYHESRCLTCRGPHQAAELLDAVEDGLGGRFRAGPRYLIVVEALQMGWSRAWVFYPSSDETPAYVVHPGGVGSGGAPLRWDAWLHATPRMERIILQALRIASSPPLLRGRSRGTVESGGALAPGSPPPWCSLRSSGLSRSLGAGARRLPGGRRSRSG